MGDGQGGRMDGVGGGGDDRMRDRGGGLAEVTVSDVSDVPDAGEVRKLFVFSCSSMETTLYISLYEETIIKFRSKRCCKRTKQWVYFTNMYTIYHKIFHSLLAKF